MTARNIHCPICTPRRTFLADLGLGFTGLALGAMLNRDGIVKAAAEPSWSPPDGKPHFAPRAKSVIWIFLSGGYSHMETFDPKPALNRYAGKSFAETPYTDPASSPLHLTRSRSVVAMKREVFTKIYPLQVGYRRHGQSGIKISDWWPNLATCVDDLSIVRSMYTTDNDHWAENQMHTGRHRLDETQPSIGAWVNYGLASGNDDLPSYVVLGGPTRSATGASIGAYYLGPEHAGVPLEINPDNPLPFGKRAASVTAQEQQREFELIADLGELTSVEYPHDEAMRARLRAYELAFRMQTAVPDALRTADETAATARLYGLDDPNTRLAGERCLAARRLVERGVRFVHLYPSLDSVWDSHSNLKESHAKESLKIDKPVAGLLKDLKQRGLWDDVVVVFCTEFGRTPAIEERGGAKDGRDHHPHGFSVWLAGAGLKQGYVHGATDELGYHALEPAHYVTDLHATVLHLLGIDFRRLEVPGRKRLDIDHGDVIHDILA